jgi:hypothetical protein
MFDFNGGVYEGIVNYYEEIVNYYEENEDVHDAESE